jgi:hypothetical protein
MLTATTPTWVRVAGALEDYLLRDGSLAMTGDLDLDDNNIVDVDELQIGNAQSALYYLRIGLDGSGNAYIERGLSGFVRWMGPANYPQFFLGDNASTGYASIDADAGMTLYFNALDAGDVRVGNLLGPVEGDTVPLGDSDDPWSVSWVLDRRHQVTSVKTGSYTAVSGEVVRVDTSGGLVAITLPDATANDGGKITVKKTTTDSNTLRVSRSGSDTVEGATQLDLTASRAYATLVSDGSSDWMRIA